MKKNFVLIPTILLLMWFFLDMIGISFNNTYLVSRSFDEDGVLFIIYLVSLLLYIFKEKIGKYVLTIWLSIWLFIQCLFHYGYQLIGQTTESKINYFSGSIKIFNVNGYFPDLYHFLLHHQLISKIYLHSFFLDTKSFYQKNLSILY